MIHHFARFDRKVLAVGDAAVQWAWDEVGVPRRMILRMLLLLMVATALLSDLQEQGRVSGVSLAICVTVLAIFHSGDIWFRRSPEIERALTAARRTAPLGVVTRGFAWAITAIGLISDQSVWNVTSNLFFLLFMLGSDTLTPGGPRRRSKVRQGRVARARA